MSELLIRMQSELVSYFLCEYSPAAPKQKLITIVRSQAKARYSAETVETFLDKRLDILRTALVDEFNSRSATKSALRYEVVDPSGEGHMLQGYRAKISDVRLAFQDVLNSLDATKFESLAAIVLKKLDCTSVFMTPQSHDQGVDAFGYRVIFPSLPRAVSHKLVWIAQAKHYVTHGVSTNAVRELIGTNELLLSRIFSTVDERYKELKLEPYSPTALLLMTTHEFPTTVRRLAERSGVFVLEASDLYDVFKNDFGTTIGLQELEEFIALETKGISVLK